MLMLLTTGCSSSNCIYPTFPNASKEVGNKIKSLHDKEVDSWIVELYKLKLKLEIKD